ncbi:MAG: VWA domain-containing protein [Candidatus Aminicenantes bacterium]|nr:VWA domain-containing protein [Candidatus Aminicenantes bacterium]
MKKFIRLAGLICLVLASVSAPRLMFGWGAIIGARHHQYIAAEAYAKLAADPAFAGSGFPPLSAIAGYEGVNIVASSALNPFGSGTGFFTGPGPDSKGNSHYSEHYYNPVTDKGGGPAAVSQYYETLRDAFLTRNRIYTSGSIGVNVPHTASYFAHYMADMNAVYHVMGMPAAEAEALLAPGSRTGGRMLIGEDVSGPTGNGTEDWTRTANYWLAAYKADPETNWYDPWYWNGLLSTSNTSTHIEWEGNWGPQTSAGQLTGYSPVFLDAQRAAGNGRPAAFAAFAKAEASYTRSKVKSAWGLLFASGIDDLLDHSIQNIYTIWRASFSALRPDFMVEQKPGAPGDDLTVIINNVEDNDPAQDVVVSVSVKGGTLKGPDSFNAGTVAANGTLEIIGIWTIENGTDQTEITIDVQGRYDQTPDSGRAVLERHLKLLMPTSVQIQPSLVDEQKQTWSLDVEVRDRYGKPVDSGEVFFQASGGSFLLGSVVLEWQKALSGGRTTKGWEQTESDPQRITVKYLGDKADPAVPDKKYLESEASITLPPERLAQSTVFVIDASGSMSGAKLAAAKDAVRAAVASYSGPQPDQEWALYAFFDCGNCPLLQGFTQNPAKIKAHLGFNAAGSTPIAYSLQKAANYLRTAGRGKTGRIILLSDGGENCSGQPVEAAKNIRTSRYLFDLTR